MDSICGGVVSTVLDTRGDAGWYIDMNRSLLPFSEDNTYRFR
jgi:hypothetical protein